MRSLGHGRSLQGTAVSVLPGPSRPRHGRRGVATAVIILVLIVLSVLVFSYFTSLRQRRFLQFKQVQGELAYAMARVASDMARTHVEAAVRTPDSKLFKALIKPAADLTPDASGRVVLETLDVLADYRALIEDMLRAQESPPDLVTRLAVTCYLKPGDFGPFEDVKAGTLSLMSTREKQGKLFIEAACTVSSGLLNDTESKVAGVREFRVIVPAMPVMSDFTLFLAEPPRNGERLKVNTIEANPKGVPQLRNALVLNNGEAKPRTDWGAKLDGPGLAKQGWVFIGGDNPLILQLTFGTKEDDLSGADADQSVGEDFQLFQGQPSNARFQRAYADREANQRIGNDPFWEIRYWDMGMPDSFNGAYLPTLGPAFGNFEHTELHANLLHLYGRPGNVSPTLVFGRVETGFFRVAAAAPRASAGADARGMFCLLPYLPPDNPLDGMYYELEVMLPPGATALPPAVLESDAGQSKAGKFLYVNPADRTLKPVSSPRVTADVYRDIASTLKRRAYNASLQFIATKGEEPYPQDRGVTFGLPPRTFVAEAAAGAPAVPASEGPYTVPQAAWPAPLASRGALDLRQIVSVMGDDKLTSGRASRRAPKAGSGVEALTKGGWLKGNKLDLGGVVEVAGPLSLPAGLSVDRGGVLIADDVTLEGDLAAPAADQPLLVVARRGGVRIERQAKVQASLAAPRGAVSIAGASEVTGQVVAKSLDLDRIETAAKFTLLSYDPGLKGGADGDARRFQIDVSKTFMQVR